MNYKVEDTVVLISTKPNIPGFVSNNEIFGIGITAGREYIVAWLGNKCTGLQGFKRPTNVRFMPCCICEQEEDFGYWHIPHWRLIKLDKLKVETEEKALA